ncbi:hypothetical protein N473_12050 [Pseudoalteromonas luteoviolacea CPMOR-1]|uniref:Uncharacterized protein n=1 Tax=Pseudoalteromonas luteoviolacea CPMOR-1 TaxID=1365248 RepID=A0A167M3P7_9GAMM|nr:hypothetical protein N473_12050 [Pseudoalteromonas luteoviolacea CPMOR-1]
MTALKPLNWCVIQKAPRANLSKINQQNGALYSWVMYQLSVNHTLCKLFSSLGVFY